MIVLGTLSLQTAEDVAATRQKILGLSKALHFDPIVATRLAFAVSEQSRWLLQAGRHPDLEVILTESAGRWELGLQFQDTEPLECAPQVKEFFDRAYPHQNGKGHTLNLRVVLPLASFGLDERFLHRERSRLEEKTRTQLLEELQQKNAELERYNSQLEQMVAARTTELQKAYQKIKLDLELAADYVRRLLPPYCNSPVTIHWQYVPTADLGGDIFGYQALDKDHFAIYLLDVTGHGLDSALLAVTVANAIRSTSLPNVDFRYPAQVLEALNDAFPMERYGDKLFTIWYAVYQPATQILRWSGGGHPEALLYPPGVTEPVRLDSLGPMMGVAQGVPFDEEERTIEPGAKLFIYSDGVHEIQISEEETWKFEEFVQFLSQVYSREEPTQLLLEHVRELNGSDQLEDDFSIMEVRF